MSEEPEYNVEAIRAWRFNKLCNSKEYFIKWENYDEDVNSWEPENHLQCDKLLYDFVKTLSESEKEKHAKDDEQLNELNGFERHAEYIKCIGFKIAPDHDDRNKFYCLIKFEDNDENESIPLDEFYNNQPEEALLFLEARLLYEEE